MRVAALLVVLSVLSVTRAQVSDGVDAWAECETVASAMSVLGRHSVGFSVEAAGVFVDAPGFGRILMSWRASFGATVLLGEYPIPFGIVFQVGTPDGAASWSATASRVDGLACLLREAHPDQLDLL